MIELQKTADYPFGEHQEAAIISLIIDHPEFFSGIARYLKHELFQRLDAQYVMAQILTYYEKYDVYPTRGFLIDAIDKSMTADDPDYEAVAVLAARESNPREIPAIKEQLLAWARSKSYGLLYDPDTMQKYYNGDFDALEEIITQARSIQDIGSGSMWFFKDVEKCFRRDTFDHLTTGFKQLDAHMHGFGPLRKEVVVWMAPTGRGKCHTLQSKIIEQKLSRIFELELENGQIIKLAGFREVQTLRGSVRVCDISKEDNITEIPNFNDTGDISLPDMWLSS